MTPHAIVTQIYAQIDGKI